MTNIDEYGWYVRIADHPISIRDLKRQKIIVYKWQVVFHTNKYLNGFPGFSPVIDFNPSDPDQARFIRSGPPPELQTIDISVVNVEIGNPVEVMETPNYSFTEDPFTRKEYDILDGLDDAQLAEVLSEARKIVLGETISEENYNEINDEDEKYEKTEPSLFDIANGVGVEDNNKNEKQAIEKLKKIVEGMTNRQFQSLKKKEVTDFLDESGIDYSDVIDNKFELISFLKGKIQGK